MTSGPIRKEACITQAGLMLIGQNKPKHRWSLRNPKLSERQTALTNEAGKTSADASFRVPLRGGHVEVITESGVDSSPVVR